MTPPTWLLGLALLAQPPARTADADAEPATGLLAERSAILSRESGQLEALADRLGQAGQAEAAAAVRGRIEPPMPEDGPRTFEPLPEVVPASGAAAGLASVPAGAPGTVEIRPILDESGAAWFALASKALDAGRYALADECLRRVLGRRPDHAEARRLLGFVPRGGAGRRPTPPGCSIRGTSITKPTAGCRPARSRTWRRGELPAPGQAGVWMPAAQADALRQQDFSRAWKIETPHFQILANVPLAEGIDFGRRLEDFHDLFTALMADVIGPHRLSLAQLHRGPGTVGPAESARKHQVSYFGTKAEYVEYLQPWEGPGIAVTLGVYIDPDTARGRRQPPRSYFYKDEGGRLDVKATLYHEVSHQLLFELAGPSAHGRNAGNFWVFEGLGTYFETVRPRPDGALLIGGRFGPPLRRGPLAGPGPRGVRADPPVHRHGPGRLQRPRSGQGPAPLRRGDGPDDLPDGPRPRPASGTVPRLRRDAFDGRLRATSGTPLAERLGLTADELGQQLRRVPGAFGLSESTDASSGSRVTVTAALTGPGPGSGRRGRPLGERPAAVAPPGRPGFATLGPS